MTPWGDGPRITLRAPGYEATFLPSAGARLVDFRWTGGSRDRSLVVPWDGQPFARHAWPKAGAFPMLPFANRLPPQGFTFRGRAVQPQPDPQGLVLHGLAHRDSWTVAEATPGTLALRWRHAPEPQWPWAFSAEQIAHLDAQGLSLQLQVRNEDTMPMPLVLGWHPYHPTPPGVTVRAGSLLAQHVLDALGRAGEPRPLPDSASRGPAPGGTLAFSGWDGCMRLQHGSEGAIVTRSPGSTCLVLHAAFDSSYLCVEPVTQLPGHLASAQDPACIAPGDTAHLRWSCAWEPATQAA